MWYSNHISTEHQPAGTERTNEDREHAVADEVEFDAKVRVIYHMESGNQVVGAWMRVASSVPTEKAIEGILKVATDELKHERVTVGLEPDPVAGIKARTVVYTLSVEAITAEVQR